MSLGPVRPRRTHPVLSLDSAKRAAARPGLAFEVVAFRVTRRAPAWRSSRLYICRGVRVRRMVCHRPRSRIPCRCLAAAAAQIIIHHHLATCPHDISSSPLLLLSLYQSHSQLSSSVDYSAGRSTRRAKSLRTPPPVASTHATAAPPQRRCSPRPHGRPRRGKVAVRRCNGGEHGSKWRVDVGALDVSPSGGDTPLGAFAKASQAPRGGQILRPYH